MRKITQEAINAFLSGFRYSNSNTGVIVEYKNGLESFVSELYLHNNQIALYSSENKKLSITNAWWFTNTTKERLNGLPNVSIKQKAGVWYLNGKEWNGEWTTL